MRLLQRQQSGGGRRVSGAITALLLCSSLILPLTIKAEADDLIYIEALIDRGQYSLALEQLTPLFSMPMKLTIKPMMSISGCIK